MYSSKSLSSAEAPAGYPYYIYKNSNDRKNSKRAGDDKKGEKAGASLLSFPSHRASRAVFLSPQPPHNTKKPVGRREALSPKILVLGYCEPVGVWWEDRILYPMNDKSKLRVVLSKQIFFFLS